MTIATDEPEYIELNLGNYSPEDVAQLNEWAIWAVEQLESAASQAVSPNPENVSGETTAGPVDSRLMRDREEAGLVVDRIAKELADPCPTIGRDNAISELMNSINDLCANNASAAIRLPVVTLDYSVAAEFEKECQRLVNDGYRLHSSSCGFVQSPEYDFCGSWMAVFVDGRPDE